MTVKEAQQINRKSVNAGGRLPPDDEAMQMEMRVNVGRDILSRSSEFRTTVDALHEYIVNAYESYNVGQVPGIEVVVETGRNGFVTIRDRGCGMTLEDMKRFWFLHNHTKRRPNGLNRRGYYGTGKVAFVAIAGQLRIDSVKDRLKSSSSLSTKTVREAAETGGQVNVNFINREVPCDDPDGTTITISRITRRMNAEDVRLLREKVAQEMMLFMQGAKVTINGIPVEPMAVVGTERRVTSECGNFSAQIVYNDCGHDGDLGGVFYSVGGVFIALDQTGKEGHRFSQRVHVKIDTTREWAAANFDECREKFISEGRDLRLKTVEPAPRALHAFADATVRSFMKELEEEDLKRREEEKCDVRKRIMAELSRAFAPFYTGGQSRRGERSGTKGATKIREVSGTRAKGGDSRNGAGSARFKADFRALENTDLPYIVEPDTTTIVFNTNNVFLRTLSQSREDHPTRVQALYDLIIESTATLDAKLWVKANHADRGQVDPMELAADYATYYVRRAAEIRNELREIYGQIQSLVVVR